ncbi:MAG: FlgD immunoglobulin-like domain containing protein [Candidatus Eisenbacteria bacterium]
MRPNPLFDFVAPPFPAALHAAALLAAALLAAVLLAAPPAAGAPAPDAPYPNVQVNSRPNNPEETAIAINPRNPDNVVGVAQVPCHWYASFDGGAGWTEGDLPDLVDLGDPSIVFDADGYAYYAFIGLFDHSGIFVNRSTDGGLTWMPNATPVVEHQGGEPFEDKSWPVADWTNSPTRNNLYVSWTRFTRYGSADPADSSTILFSRSTDRGQSFSAPIRIGDEAGDAIDSDGTVEGAVPAVGPQGEVYVAWAGPRGIEFDRSLDAGRTFGRDRVIADQPGGWDFDVPGIYRANGLPVTRVDLSGGPFRGRIYVNWSDQRNGDTDVFLIHSDDRGGSWSAPRRVHGDPIGNGRDQFFTWFDVDPVTGAVRVVFYDRRQHPDNLTTDVFLATSFDGGETFLEEKISASSFIPDPTVFFGDYIGISSFADRVRPLWVRMDGRTLSIWTALIDPPSAGVCDPAGCSPPHLSILPNPMRAEATILCCDGLTEPVVLTVHDVSGRRVRELRAGGRTAGGAQAVVWDGRGENGDRVPPGIYWISGRAIPASRIVVVH